MSVLGLDIGGANLKGSDGEQTSLSVPFPLWKQPEQLAEALIRLAAEFPPARLIAVTMTGELADCFRTKSEGVERILDAVTELAAGRDVWVWQTGGELIDRWTALELVPLVAAANWHALATWAGRLVPEGPALLIDMGSTTTDLIPLENGFPMPTGRTDPERLLSGELLYVGLRRTPLIGLLHIVQLDGLLRPLANELFATTWDALLLTGDVPESNSLETANGQPATIEYAQIRLARQLCGDETEFTADQLREFAYQIRAELQRRIQTAANRVERRAGCPVIYSGEGSDFVASALSVTESYNLNKLLGPCHSQAACAYAVARLTAEWATC